MIVERISDIPFRYFPSKVPEAKHISRIRFLQNVQKSIESDVLYITTLSYLSSSYKGVIPQKIACIKDVNFDIDDKIYENSDVIFIETSIETFELSDLLQAIFRYYSSISDELLGIVEQNIGLQFLVDRMAAIFKNPICVFGNFKVLAESNYKAKNEELYKKSRAANIHKGYIIRLDKQYNMINNAKSRLDQNDKPVLLDKSEGFESSRIIYNLKVSKKYIARLGILEVDTPFTDATYDLIIFFSRILSLELQKNEMLMQSSDLKLGALYADLLRGNNLSNNDIEKILSYLSFSMGNHYLLMVITAPTLSYDSKLAYLKNQILNLIHSNFCILFEQKIVIMLESSSDSFYTDHIISKLSELLSISGMFAGISRSFTNFKDIRKGYLEASKAVELGLKLNVDNPIFQYTDFQFYHLFEQCSQHEDIKSLCLPSLLKLIEYDNELSKTLYLYLKNGQSQSATAKALHIQRSSLLYRLKNIEEVLDMKLGDYQSLLHLKLSYEILRYLNFNNMNNHSHDKGPVRTS